MHPTDVVLQQSFPAIMVPPRVEGDADGATW